jgi:hypothetical protein
MCHRAQARTCPHLDGILRNDQSRPEFDGLPLGRRAQPDRQGSDGRPQTQRWPAQK